MAIGIFYQIKKPEAVANAACVVSTLTLNALLQAPAAVVGSSSGPSTSGQVENVLSEQVRSAQLFGASAVTASPPSAQVGGQPGWSGSWLSGRQVVS